MDAAQIEAHTKKLQQALTQSPESALKACEEFELEHCGAADPAAMLPFYRIHLISYLLLDDLVNARWLWERMPDRIKGDPELQAVWKVAQHLWKRELKEVYALLTSTSWTPPLNSLSASVLEGVRSRQMKLIGQSHSAIAVSDCSEMLGLPPQEAVARCAVQGWKEEGGFVRPAPPEEEGSPVVGKKLLQDLTEYVCKLDAR
uniref:CSN8/PSMD8/EIF3K domain-containing protein n=1 Tax=Hemiselmis andersenii TaxID=464988 RepID=A0A6U4MZW9_HEMAN|mmetsp:Transcript_22717/g.52770  ORF Transcript_22717/g.52770 Transcript_22717/m.52770 type:complete len:202 (-) Transcript_22717:97-702(-)